MGTEPAPGRDPALLLEQTLEGRFRVESLVAEGGFGIVYRARQVALDRPVALKVLKTPPGLSGADEAVFRRTFESEARTIARLKHPHIVEVYDFGVTPGTDRPLHWMALEWLEGRTLEGFLADRAAGPMPPAQVLALLGPVAQAIAFAHRQGVAHRDLKPANVFVVEPRGGEAPFPKVLDFGIAKITAAEERPAGTNTTGGFPAFSPDYAAPEQVCGQRTGAWTDVHALGLLFTELLTGRPPYPRGEVSETFAAVVSERRPTPGPLAAPHAHWEPVLARAVARRPRDRQPDAGALIAELEAPRPAATAAHRRAGVVGGLGVAALAALAAAAFLGWRGLHGGGQAGRSTLAVLPFENLSGDPQQEYFSDGLTEEMISQLGRVQPDRLAVIARTSVMHYKQAKKTVKDIGRELAVDYVLESSVNRSGDRVRVSSHLVKVSDETQVWADSYDRELKDMLGLQGDIVQAIAAGVRLKLTAGKVAGAAGPQTANPEAHDLYLKGRSFESRFTAEGERQAVAYYERATTLDPRYAAPYVGLAGAWNTLVGLDAAPVNDLIPGARTAALHALELDEQLPEAHGILGMILLGHYWDFAGAERHLRRALELDPNDERCHLWYGRYLKILGRFDEAIAHFERAVAISPRSANAAMWLADACGYARQYDRAVAHARRAIELDPGSTVPHLILSWIYSEKHLYPESLAELTKAGDDNQSLSDYVAVYLRAGRRADALRAFHRVETLARTGYVPAMVFAKAQMSLGHPTEALEWLEKAFAERSYELTDLRIDSTWDPVRKDPHFVDLVRRVGIPEPSGR